VHRTLFTCLQKKRTFWVVLVTPNPFSQTIPGPDNMEVSAGHMVNAYSGREHVFGQQLGTWFQVRVNLHLWVCATISSLA